MLTKNKAENLIIEKEKIKEILSAIIRNGLDFVALGIVEKSPGERFLLCEAGFKNPLWKTPGGRPKIRGDTKENPLDTVSRKIYEEMGIITYQPEVDNIFLIQEIQKHERKYYCIAFDLKYFSGEVKKGDEIAELREFSKNGVREIILSKKMVPLHVSIWRRYLVNYWK